MAYSRTGWGYSNSGNYSGGYSGQEYHNYGEEEVYGYAKGKRKYKQKYYEGKNYGYYGKPYTSSAENYKKFGYKKQKSYGPPKRNTDLRFSERKENLNTTFEGRNEVREEGKGDKNLNIGSGRNLKLRKNSFNYSQKDSEASEADFVNNPYTDVSQPKKQFGRQASMKEGSGKNLNMSQDFENSSIETDDAAVNMSNLSFSVEGDGKSTTTWDNVTEESNWKVGKYHNPSIYCLKNCSSWRLKIRKSHTPYNHVIKGKFDLTEKENQMKTYILTKHVAIRGQEVNVDFLQDLQEADNCTSIQSIIQLETGYDSTKEGLSLPASIDTSNTEKSSELLEALFPINNENNISDFTQCINLSENKDNLLWVEFEVGKDLEESHLLKVLDQGMVESHFHFKLNGRIHKKNVFQRDLDYALNGKKIVKSIQNRLNTYALHLFRKKRGSNARMDKFDDFKNNIKLSKKEFYVKIINISQSFGIKIEVDTAHQSFGHRKPINIFTANFNKIVKAGIKIKSLIFSFAIPDHQLVVDESMLGTQDILPLESKFSEPDNLLTNLELFRSQSTTNSGLNVEKRVVTQKLSTKSKSYNLNSSRYVPKNIVSHKENLEVKVAYSPFETFLLCSTPFVTELLQTDTLASVLSNMETFSDLGVEVSYKDSSGNSCLDVYLPTLKSLWIVYRPDFQRVDFETVEYSESEPFYNRVPFLDKVQELEGSHECSQALQVQLPLILSTSWIWIEWFLHYSSNSKWKNTMQKSLVMYYAIDFSKKNSYFPVYKWEVDNLGEKMWAEYQAFGYDYYSSQTYDVNSLLYR